MAVENSTWEEENELQEMYLSRKTYAFNADNPGEMNQNRDVFESVMKTADVTFQNLDSSEISLTDVRAEFEKLKSVHKSPLTTMKGSVNK